VAALLYKSMDRPKIVEFRKIEIQE